MNHEHFNILKSGVENWNSWRKFNPLIIPDLSDACITDNVCSSYVIYVNLQNLNLRDANLTNTTFKNVDLRSSDLRDATMTFTRFLNVDLRYSNFNGTTLLNSKLHNCDLLYANFSSAELINVNLINCNFLR